MRIECKKPIDKEIERFTQLTNKSNQFNLRTRRYSEAEVLDLLEDENKSIISDVLISQDDPKGLNICDLSKRERKITSLFTILSLQN